MTAAAPLPPPPPPADAGPRDDARGRNTLAGLAVLGLILALVFGFLWLGARSGREDAASERDIALAERDAANETAISLSNELAATKDQLADAESEGAATGTSEADDLQAEVDRLTAENEALTAELAAATTLPEPTPSVPPTTATPTTATPTTAAPTTAAPSADEIGEWLASLYRNNVLGPIQEACLGQTVLNDLGADQLTEILGSGDDAGTDEALIESLEAAASECGIDPSAIFG